VPGIPAGLPPKSLSNSGQRGLTGRLRSKADQDQERLASHRGYRLLLQPTELCRYLWPSQASQLPHLVWRQAIERIRAAHCASSASSARATQGSDRSISKTVLGGNHYLSWHPIHPGIEVQPEISDSVLGLPLGRCLPNLRGSLQIQRPGFAARLNSRRTASTSR
jgi:hypothetical protein